MQPTEDWLLCSRLRDLAARVATADDEFEADRAWQEMETSVEETGAGNVPEIWTPILGQDLAALQALVDAWFTRCRRLCPHDETLLQRALRAFRAAAIGTGADGPEAGARVRLLPPAGFPEDVWPLLATRGSLTFAGDGRYELAHPSSDSIARGA